MTPAKKLEHKFINLFTIYAPRTFDFWKERKMPVATMPTSDGDRKDLKTVPDGFVKIKRMSYGESLTRQSMSSKISIGGTNKSDFSGELDIDQKAIALYDFANCIVDHNLTDANDRKLNFKDPKDVNSLERTVGEEIGQLIDEINDVEQSEEVKN